MADHSELVAELAVIEKMTNHERMKQARKRRNQQLKKWNQREKEWTSKKKKTEQNMLSKRPNQNILKKKEYKVHFVPSVMLLEGAARNDVDEVRRLLLLGVSPDSTNEDGLTALHQCCIDDSEDMLKLLIEFGANINAKDSEQWTPLHAAATCGLIHLVEYLISKGADLLSVNADGNMPYDICEDEATLDFIEVEMAKKGITQEMIDNTRAAIENQMLTDLKVYYDNDGDLEYRDQQGATPLHIASANGYVSVVEFLLDHSCSLDVSDKDMWQPIHAAACWGHPDVIEILVQNGADLSAKTKNGETPYDICEDPELKERIIQLRCEMETKRASQPQKLRRSQSQNTRSQSVRRTSIREKTQISRREALEEARIRHEKQETSHPKPEEDEEAKLLKDRSEKETIVSNGPKDEKEEVEEDELILPSSILSSGKDTLQKFKSGEKESPKGKINNMLRQSNQDALDPEPPEMQIVPLSSDPSSPLYSDASTLKNLPTTGGDSVTVEILVTFNASNSGAAFVPSPGTLADLKKQRNDIRNNSVSSGSSGKGSKNGGGGRLTLSSTTTNGSQQDHISGKKGARGGGGGPSRNGHCITATYTYDQPPPSPSLAMQKYRSDPSEIVGEPHSKGCCSLM